MCRKDLGGCLRTKLKLYVIPIPIVNRIECRVKRKKIWPPLNDGAWVCRYAHRALAKSVTLSVHERVALTPGAKHTPGPLHTASDRSASRSREKTVDLRVMTGVWLADPAARTLLTTGKTPPVRVPSLPPLPYG